MKAIRLLLVSFFVLCVSTTNVVASKSNESDKAKIQRAMKAAPKSISAGAEIRDVDEDWTILRERTEGNDWTCFPGVPVNDGDKHPMCNDEVWMDWLWAVKLLLDGGDWLFETEIVGFSYMLRGDARVDNNNPLAQPGAEGMWDQEGPHIMMLFPTNTEIGLLPRDPNAGGPYVMWGDWPLIHVMVPLTDRDR
jgi:hypothetical protein